MMKKEYLKIILILILLFSPLIPFTMAGIVFFRYSGGMFIMFQLGFCMAMVVYGFCVLWFLYRLYNGIKNLDV